MLTQTVNWLVQHYISPSITIAQASFNYPRELILNDITFNSNKTNPNSMTLWFNPFSPLSNQYLSLNTVLIKNVDLFESSFYLKKIPVPIHKIAFKNSNYHGTGYQLIDTNIQIKKPKWSSHSLVPYGEVQLQSNQIKLKTAILKNVLLDMDYTKNKSKIYGLSFDFNSAKITIQAQQNLNDQWEILSLTVNKLAITPKLLNQLNSILSESKFPLATIQRLDVLNSSYEDSIFKVNNVSFSVNNLDMIEPKNIWSQKNMTLSASADSILYAGKQWVNPSLTATVSQSKVNITNFSANLYDGYLRLSASMTSKKLDINTLLIENIKYFFESKENILQISKIPYSNIYINHLKIRNSQIIQIAQHPYWQLSGINMDVNKADILDKKKLGLWSGQLELSANNVSYGDIKGTQSIVQMHTQNKTWYLDRLFLPVQQGYADMSGAWNFDANDGAWSLDMKTDSFPIQSICKYMNLPVSVFGLADISLQSKGLSGNDKILRQTLTANATVDMRQGTLHIPNSNENLSLPFLLNNIIITSSRGNINISTKKSGNSLSDEATLSGSVDLSEKNKGSLQLMIKNRQCGNISINLMNSLKKDIQCK